MPDRTFKREKTMKRDWEKWLPATLVRAVQVEDATPINIADDAPVLIAETGEEKTYAEIRAEEIE